MGRIKHGDLSFGVSNSGFYGFSPDRAILYTLLIIVFFFLFSCFLKPRFEVYSVPAQTRYSIEKFVPVSLGILSSLGHAVNQIKTIEVRDLNFQWDNLNLETWGMLFASGRHPMRDFWYPYGGILYLDNGYFGAFTASFILGFIVFVLVSRVMKSNLSYLNKSILVFGFCNLIIMDSSNAIRYGLPIMSLMLWIRYVNGDKYSFLPSLLIGFCFFLSPEVSVLTFGVFTLLVVLFYSQLRKLDFSQFFIKVLIPYVIFLVNLIQLFLNGALPNTFALVFKPEQILQLVSSLNYGLDATQPVFSGSSLIIILLLFSSLASNPFRRIIENKESQKSTFSLVFITVIFLTYFLQKDLTRGGMLMPAILACLPILDSRLFPKDQEPGFNRQHPRSRIFSFVNNTSSRVILIYLLIFSGVLNNFVGTFTSMPSDLSKIGQRIPTLKDNFFKNSYSQNLVKKDEEVENFLKNYGSTAIKDVFVLGDRSYFYWVKGARHYWTISNWSTIIDQGKTLNQLKRSPPKYIYLDTTEPTLTYDLVPPYIRSPQIYSWVVKNYVFSSRGAFGDFLIRKQPLETNSLDYWQKIFGNQLFLGYMGYGTTIPNACSVSKPCAPYLVNQFSQGEQVGYVDIFCGKTKFNITFSTKKEGNFVFPLNRLWFWNNDCEIGGSRPKMKLTYLSELPYDVAY